MWYDNTGVTVELNDIIQSGVDIWNFDYPVPRAVVEYNGKTATVPFSKKGLEQKIIDHYRFRQIGQETVGRWLHYFRTRMREIMPYYVQLYEFEAKWWNVDDPLESYNLKETFEQETTDQGTSSGTAKGNTSSETSSETSGTTTRDGESTRNATSEKESSGTVEGSENKTNRFSDTPQGSISNLDNYMTNASKDELTRSEDTTGTESITDSETGTSSETVTDQSTSSGTTSGTSSETTSQSSENTGTLRHTMTRRGNIGVQPLGGEVQNIREAFINIDMMIIKELNDLFLMIY